jgi:membrane protein DedA with SNARE-associated domain
MMHFLTRYGLLFVFADVLLAQLGLPIPAMPTLIVAGAAASGGRLSVSPTLAVAISAAMAADTLWFVAGRVYGPAVLKFLWGLSLFSGSSFQQAKTCFERWGPIALVVAKFIPGFSIIAPPLAGSAQYGWAFFLLLDSIGTVLWASVAVGLGNRFHAEINDLIERLEDFGKIALGVLLVLLMGYVIYRFWQRRRLPYF